MTQIIIFTAGILIGIAVASMYFRRKYSQMYNDKVGQLGMLPDRVIDDNDAWSMYTKLILFIDERYRMLYLRHNNSEVFRSDSLAIVSFIRCIHNAGCRIKVEAVSRKDIEVDGDVADDLIVAQEESRRRNDRNQAYG